MRMAMLLNAGWRHRRGASDAAQVKQLRRDGALDAKGRGRDTSSSTLSLASRLAARSSATSGVRLAGVAGPCGTPGPLLACTRRGMSR